MYDVNMSDFCISFNNLVLFRWLKQASISVQIVANQIKLFVMLVELKFMAGKRMTIHGAEHNQLLFSF